MGDLIHHQVSTKGTVVLPLTGAIKITANATLAVAAAGGRLASDTTPAMARVNGATDKALKLTWAATNVTEIQWNVVAPDDLDNAHPVIVQLYGLMGGATDTPVVGVGFFAGIGDTDAGGNTAAFGSSAAKTSVTILAANVGNPGDTWNIMLIPAAHGTDALVLYSARIEYTRK